MGDACTTGWADLPKLWLVSLLRHVQAAEDVQAFGSLACTSHSLRELTAHTFCTIICKMSSHTAAGQMEHVKQCLSKYRHQIGRIKLVGYADMMWLVYDEHSATWQQPFILHLPLPGTSFSTTLQSIAGTSTQQRCSCPITVGLQVAQLLVTWPWAPLPSLGSCYECFSVQRIARQHGTANTLGA